MFKVGIGQDSHRFVEEGDIKELVLGGVTIPGERGLAGNSDADVILHALTNGISGVTGVNILGGKADELCLGEGITDSVVYLKKGLEYLGDWRVTHVSFTVEAKTPKLKPHVDAIRENVAKLLGITMSDVCLTATTGEGLTDFGRGLGMQVFVTVTAMKQG